MFARHLIRSGNQLPRLFVPKFSMAYDASNKVHNRIHDLIHKSPKKTFVFMKGDPKEPACRYSGVVVQILNLYDVDFDSFNVLDDEDVRYAIKKYSNWPTIPQVYKDGKFIGGCDILLQMHETGELKNLFPIENYEDNKEV